MKVHEYTLESSWSIAFNATSVKCFRHSSKVAECFYCRLVRVSTVSLTSKFLCKIVPIYNISWYMLRVVWKCIKSTFQRIQWHLIWSFQDEVIVKTRKTAQKTSSHAETHQECGVPFHIGCLFVFCFVFSPIPEVCSLYKYPFAS
jgi:hypothetical protein